VKISQKALVIFLFFLFYLIYSQQVLAASLSIESTPSTVDQSQEFSTNALLSCSGCSDSYLRGVFYPSGTSYFGYTQDNSGNWSNSPGSACTTFYKVLQTDLVNGSWSGTLKFKPDKDSSYYNGPGEYTFKVGRYTSSCSSPSAWSNEVTIAITGPTLTPTPTSNPTSQTTVNPTPTPTPIKTPTPTKSITPSPKPTEDSSIQILAFDTSPTPENKPQTAVLGQSSGNAGFYFILSGALLLVAGIYIFIRKNKFSLKDKFGI